MKPIDFREYVNNLGLQLGQHLFFTSIRYGPLSPVFGGASQKDAEWIKNHIGVILIIAGIANPMPLRQFALGLNPNISEMYFPDHHNYSKKDIVRIARKYDELSAANELIDKGKKVLILTTEKDAMRLKTHEPQKEEVRDAFHSVRIYVSFLNNDKDEFDQQIRNYVNSNKRSSILYQ